MIGFLMAAAFSGAVAGLWIWHLVSTRHRNEQSAAATLKALASAQADFRGNDRDGNRIQDFWTGDVATLASWNLIEEEVADADAKPLLKRVPSPAPREGYLFVVMETDESGASYVQDTQGLPNRGPLHNHSKFAFCAYPASYPRSGKWTFLINESNSVFKIDTGGKPVLVWPSDDSHCKKCLQKPHPGTTCSWALQ